MSSHDLKQGAGWEATHRGNIDRYFIFVSRNKPVAIEGEAMEPSLGILQRGLNEI